MHAMKRKDIYIHLSISVAAGGKHGKRQGEFATGFYSPRGGWGSKEGTAQGGTANIHRLALSCKRIQSNYCGSAIFLRVRVRVIDKPSSSVANLTHCLCAAIIENKVNAVSGT